MNFIFYQYSTAKQ